MVRKLLSILFILIFTSQVLPIEQVGKILWKGNLTEEVNETQHQVTKSVATDPFWYLTYIHSESRSIEKIISFIHALADEALIKCFHLDVLIQPPNFC